jgi:teichuronic acid biosynthesis glycosyltransferase TuaC
LKVLLVTTSYPTSNEDPSGHFVRAEARLLARAGHEVHVVAPLAASEVSLERDPAVPSLFVHRVGGSALFGWPGAVANIRTNPLRIVHALPFAVVARREITLVGHVDRVIGHWIVPAGMPLLWDHPAALELVAHGADVRLLCALPQPIRATIVTTLLGRGARFRFVASSSLETLARTLPAHVEARLIGASYVEPAAIDLPDVAAMANEVRATHHAEAGGFVVAVGRLIELKRFDLALRAAAAANVPIVLVGDGPMRAHLEEIARETHARATFTGLLPRTETLAWIAASRALVHPSRAEAAPTVVREARALGVPVIATACGDLAEWARRDSGIVIVDPQRDALARAIVSVFAPHPLSNFALLRKATWRGGTEHRGLSGSPLSTQRSGVGEGDGG